MPMLSQHSTLPVTFPAHGNLRWRPHLVSLLYVLFAGSWILLSTFFVNRLITDREFLAFAESLKGFLFVAATGSVLFFLLHRWQRRSRYAEAFFATSREGIVVTDPQGRVEMVNPAFTLITGYSLPEVRGRRVADFSVSAEQHAAIEQGLKRHGAWRGEIWSTRKNGEAYPKLLSVTSIRDEDGIIFNYVGVFADLSAQRASERERDYLAHHDPLTGLPNRATMTQTLVRSVETALRDKQHSAVLMLNLDRFQYINDSYGHAAGDNLLVDVAARLREVVRPEDAILRLGGDEFLIIVNQLSDTHDAAQVAKKLLHALHRSWRTPAGDELSISGSIGISVAPVHGTRPEQLLQNADAALHAAKLEARGGFRFFSEGLTEAARERIETEARLHHALAHDELRLYLQPQVDIASGRIVAAEALLRWHDPQRGLIPPDRFIPIAEASGLMHDIGRWVLEHTCRFGRSWLDQGLEPLVLAVNISPHQFRQQDVRALVEDTLASTGFPAHLLELELTESALMDKGDCAAEALAGLRALGVRLAIDDFGTGYSSMAYLKHFPVDVLKIDRSFVTDLPDGRDDAAIATAIVRMGHSLGLKVLAEGVETASQQAYLSGIGCDMYQGYLCSPAVPSEQLAQLVRTTQGAQPPLAAPFV